MLSGTLPPNSVIIGYATEGTLPISVHLSTKFTCLPLWTATCLYTPSHTLRSSSATRMLKIQQYKCKTHGFRTFSCFLDPAFGIHSHKTLDTAQPCHKTLDIAQPYHKTLDTAQPCHKTLDIVQPCHKTLDIAQPCHKTLDTAQPRHLLKPNWKPSSSHSIFSPTNSCTQFLLQSCACVCVCVSVQYFM